MQSERRLEPISPAAKLAAATALVVALALVIVHLTRIFAEPLPLPAILLAVAAAWIAADLASGLVHWAADSWGSESMPILGPRFLTPFRVHHVNADDILNRGFLDLNGDVALATLPVLIAAWWIPVTSVPSRAVALFVIATCAVALPTNQVHQWAHMRQPPAAVRWLQRRRLILTRDMHAIHHESPYATHYCIATGWCNRLLARVDFFRRAEQLLTVMTGAMPRADEDRQRGVTRASAEQQKAHTARAE